MGFFGTPKAGRIIITLPALRCAAPSPHTFRLPAPLLLISPALPPEARPPLNPLLALSVRLGSALPHPAWTLPARGPSRSASLRIPGGSHSVDFTPLPWIDVAPPKKAIVSIFSALYILGQLPLLRRELRPRSFRFFWVVRSGAISFPFFFLVSLDITSVVPT